MCNECISKEHCDYIKKGDVQNCLKRSMASPNDGEWYNYIANWNGWLQDL